jgi:ABC-type uncharacterized transport system substrate-binding protein
LYVYHWAEGRNDRFVEIAAGFVRLKVDIIVTAGSAVPQAKQATSTIPIVFAVAADPLGAGLVASLARRGGNVTGLSLQSNDLAAKRLEILRDVIPGLRRLAVLANVGYAGSALEMRDVQATARTLGILLAFGKGAHVPRRHQPRIVPERVKSALPPDSADQARREAAGYWIAEASSAHRSPLIGRSTAAANAFDHSTELRVFLIQFLLGQRLGLCHIDQLRLPMTDGRRPWQGRFFAP